MSFLGYICCAHANEGEKVGINKQLAIFASITRASFGEVIKNIVLADKDCTPLDTITVNDIANSGLCNIFVNGDWIGVCSSALEFAMKYRQKRRALEISPEITIVWDSRENEVCFWTDVGRMIRPLLIVYNNKRDPEFFPNDKYDEKKRNFRQNIALTQKHIDAILARQITVDDLLRDRIIEYISAEEQENMYLCASYSRLKEYANNELHDFTHCDIEQAMVGITALISPMTSHNPVVRTVYLTGQAKQTCSVYSLNWVHRADKEGYVQYQSESPLVKTAINRYLFPNGNNIMIAIMCYTGYNQEDSLIVSKGAVERGLFDSSKLTFYKTKLEQREEFASPTHATEKIRVACYSKLVNGIVPVGTIVYKDDALIGKIAKVPSQDKGYVTVDRSVIYKDIEPAIVHDVIVDRNEQDERIAKVVLRKIRPVSVGDKFSILKDSEVLTDKGWKEIQHINIAEDKVASLDLNGNLDYVYPSGLSVYNYNGQMYSLKSQQVQMYVTKNHKVYVKRQHHDKFELLRTYEAFGQRVKYKTWANNDKSDIMQYLARDINGSITAYSMDAWLKLLGIWYADGYCSDKKEVVLYATKQHKQCFHIQLLDELGVEYKIFNDRTVVSGAGYPAIYNELQPLSVNEISKYLPNYVWNLSKRQSRILLNSMIEYDGSYNANGSAGYYTSSKRLADDVVRVALHAGWSGCIKKKSDPDTPYYIKTHIGTSNADSYYIRINKTKTEPHINYGHIKQQKNQEETYEQYEGQVWCLEMPNTHQHVYYYRMDKYSSPHFTGNSSRAGLTITAKFWPAKGDQ